MTSSTVKMTDIDISTLSYDELRDLKNSVDRRLSEVLTTRRADLVRELEELDDQISKSNFTASAPRLKNAKRNLSPKYKGPNGETWTGMGRTPRWLEDFERGGGERSQLLTES